MPGLLAYRDTVGRETRAWVRDLDFDTLDVVLDVAARIAAAPPIVSERAAWLPRFYAAKSAAFLLSFPINGHGYMHWAEARVTRDRLGFRRPMTAGVDPMGQAVRCSRSGRLTSRGRSWWTQWLASAMRSTRTLGTQASTPSVRSGTSAVSCMPQISSVGAAMGGGCRTWSQGDAATSAR